MKMQNLLMMLCSLELGAFEVIMDRHCPEAEADFQYHWRKMTGKDAVLKVEKHPYTVTKKSFFQESFRLRSVKGEGRVYISGEGPTGVSHGLYEVLQRLGCDWIMPGELGEVIPKVDKPELGDLDIEQAPADEA